MLHAPASGDAASCYTHSCAWFFRKLFPQAILEHDLRRNPSTGDSPSKLPAPLLISIISNPFKIVCGSSHNISFQGQTFAPDSYQSSFLLTNEGESFVSDCSSNVPSPIYRSLRIFPQASSYEFEIRQQGRHWLRLYFHPLPHSGHDLSSASIAVVTENFGLLNNFTFKNQNKPYLFKEYIVNVTTDSLTINFVPSNDSVISVNVIEVVSIPLDLSPSTPLGGLSNAALETIHRLNMGGPFLTQNDTLGRTWGNDVKHLYVNSSTVNVSVPPSIIKYPAGVTPETTPNWVYATAETMGDPKVANANFNITWIFPVDPSFIYFVRVHFCEVVSSTLKELVFKEYVNSEVAITSLDLFRKGGDLAVPYYKEFIANFSTNSSVIYGPDVIDDATDAILNGLEITKISNGAGSLLVWGISC